MTRLLCLVGYASLALLLPVPSIDFHTPRHEAKVMFSLLSVNSEPTMRQRTLIGTHSLHFQNGDNFEIKVVHRAKFEKIDASRGSRGTADECEKPENESGGKRPSRSCFISPHVLNIPLWCDSLSPTESWNVTDFDSDRRFCILRGFKQFCFKRSAATSPRYSRSFWVLNFESSPFTYID